MARAGYVAVTGLSCLALAVTLAQAGTSAAPARCGAAPVQYGGNGFLPRERAPWVSAGSGSDRIAGFLYVHELNLGDARVRKAGLTIYAGRQNKIAWVPRRLDGIGKWLTITARQLDGRGAIRWRFPRAIPLSFPSGLTLPTPGCWRLSLRSGGRRWTLDVRAIAPPAAARCDTTAVRTGRHPVDPSFDEWVELTPRSSGISGTFSVAVPGTAGAAIYAGGRWPDGAQTKILWITRKPWLVMRIRGTQLDGGGFFEQSARAAGSSALGGAFPSVVVVPAPGCWALTARTGPRGGVLVIRALPLP
jgi:hypothetical protein